MRQATQKAAREEPSLRREQILDETIRILGEQGYHGFTIQELAKRCGLSNAGLLYYFGSKDLLLIAVLDEIRNIVSRRIGAPPTAITPAVATWTRPHRATAATTPGA